MDPTSTFVGLIVLALALALGLSGLVAGIAGFGFAMLGTMALATVLEPREAIILMIVPIIAVNLGLLTELSAADLQSCGRRFGPLVAAGLIGTVVGMIVLDRVPTNPLRVGLGALSLGYVVLGLLQRSRVAHGRNEWWRVLELRPVMLAVGMVSGLIFGGTNVGVQFIAYLRSFGLRHGVFVGVVAMVFLGMNTARIGAAWTLGMYPDVLTSLVSVFGAFPAAIGVFLGSRIRGRFGPLAREVLVMALLSIIGVRLLLAGVGVG